MAVENADCPDKLKTRKRCMARRNMAGNIAGSVSAIDDAEMKGYFNTKKEMIYKKIIWDMMNKEYLQGKNQKREEPRNKKSKISAAAANTNDAKKKKRVETETEGEKKKRQRLSSKINLDVLEKQEEESGRREESFGYGHGEESDEKSIAETQENYGEENEENDYGNVYYGEEEDEEQGYNFDEDGDYEDY